MHPYPPKVTKYTGTAERKKYRSAAQLGQNYLGIVTKKRTALVDRPCWWSFEQLQG